MSPPKRNILITGSGGFVAARLLPRLPEEFHPILEIRNPEKAARARSQGMLVLPSSLSPKEIANTVQGPIHCVIHLIGGFRGKTEDLIENNFTSTLRVVGLMESLGIPKIIYLSSAAVYGETPDEPIGENFEPNPVTNYGLIKLTGEKLLKDHIASNRIRSAFALRSNNIYGPGSADGVVARFASRILAGEPVLIDGDGSQIREPLFIDDLVEAIICSLKSELGGFRPYNVSGNEGLTVYEILSTISRAANRPLSITHSGKPAGLPHTLRLSTKLAKAELHWAPRTSFEAGVRKTLEGLK